VTGPSQIVAAGLTGEAAAWRPWETGRWETGRRKTGPGRIVAVVTYMDRI
jgi:hypothetical protein